MPALVPSVAFEVCFPNLAGHALIDEGRPVEGEIGIIVHDVLLLGERTWLSDGGAAVWEDPFVEVV